MNPGSCLVDDPGVANLQLLSHAEQQDILLLQQAILESVAQGHDPLTSSTKFAAWKSGCCPMPWAR